MVHNYHKVQDFRGNLTAAAGTILSMISQGLPTNATLGGLGADGRYHIDGCASPEYRCFPPFDAEPARQPNCKIDRDCSYALSQLRWGLRTALQLAAAQGEAPSPAGPSCNRNPQPCVGEPGHTFCPSDGRKGQCQSKPVKACPPCHTHASAADIAWWTELQAKLVDYPVDESTGFRLSSNCSFLCPHRHFSHLLQIYDLENTLVGVDAALDKLISKSIDNFYRVSCNESNWFNEECRGFTQCGLASMNAVSGRREAAAVSVTQTANSY
jgi:hypothetical protein